VTAGRPVTAPTAQKLIEDIEEQVEAGDEQNDAMVTAEQKLVDRIGATSSAPRTTASASSSRSSSRRSWRARC
jgi:hypothetical protein